MIIAAPLKQKFASITSNAKIEYVESSDPEIRGKVRIKGAVAYLYLPKINDDGIDTHVGVQYTETNLDLQLDSPHKMKKLGLFKNAFDENNYTLKFANTCANEFMEHSNQGKKSSSNAPDAFSFIVSCTDNELATLKTDEEKAQFLINSAKETLLELSNSKTNIEFKYMIVPHLKDGNPHVHVLMSTRRLDGYRPSFFRGKKHSGIIKKMRDVKYRLEEKYPFLLQMEHEDRAKTIDVLINPNTGKIYGKHVELVNRIESITSQFVGQDFSYPKFTIALRESGFEVVDDYLKGKQHIKIKHKDYGDDFLSIDTLPHQTKGVLELHAAYKYKANQTKTDVSLIVSKAVALINASDMSNGFEELNKKLYQDLGARLVPNISKNKSGEREVSGWSIYLDEFDFKISAKKSGVIIDNKLKIDMDEVESINSLYQMVKKQNIQKQVTEATVNGSITIADGRKKKIKFRFIDNTETLQDFITRFNENSRYGPSITKQMIVGNTVVSKFNQRDVCTIVGNAVETYQTDLNSALITMSIHIAKGHTKIRCTGEPNPRTQANLYLASRICGTTLLDYTPSPELVREADSMMDKEYKKLVIANRQRVRDAVAIRATGPTGKKVFVQTNNRMDREVDARPKLYGFLYGIHKGLAFQDFTYVQHLNDLPRSLKKRVIDDLRKDEQLSANDLDSILIRAGITLEDAPPAKPPAHVPALAAQNQKPALATHSAPAVIEQEKPDEPGSLTSAKPRDTRRPPSKPGEA
ncbi:hypothetical protein [Pseudomonas lurida]|uniref:hypothetical protein n=1 Tax=Pseudomonas lurida TaxID=244566 RepID=UPI00273239E6|nr:hypothetical protein [Pseudomonas lurida]WLG29625.1 hypothetical protein PSH68_05445 [Pseudomonas lurida]